MNDPLFVLPQEAKIVLFEVFRTAIFGVLTVQVKPVEVVVTDGQAGENMTEGSADVFLQASYFHIDKLPLCLRNAHQAQTDPLP